MIGNDIVDLKLAKIESNWRRRGFLDKIFTRHEQELILNDSNPEIMVWNLWTRKEAAYKIWNRKTKIRSFNPVQFECFEVENEIGLVKAFDAIYYTKTIVNQNFTYSTAATYKSQFVKLQEIDRNAIVKINGLPFIKDGANKAIISITNHGVFEKIIKLN